MNWHSLFDLHTMEHRHLLLAYAAVWVVQGGYLARTAWGWFRLKPPRL